jgi:2-dehydropantoate 2-reductase
MNIVVLGAGAIGSLYAAKLSVANDVTVLARAAHAEAINAAGLRVIGRENATCRMRAVTTLTAIPDNALVLLATKVNDNFATVQSIVRLLRRDTTIVCIQNGLGGEQIVRAVVADRPKNQRPAVLRGVTQFGAIFRSPGVVEYKVTGFTLLERSPRSAAIAELLTASGLDGRVSDDIKVDVWRKLIFNCVINPITSIIGSEVGGIADARLNPIKQLVIDECLAVAGADGARFEIDFLTAITETFGPSTNVASMRQDLIKRKPTEIDFMNGAVVELGKRYGLDCPVNAALVAIIKGLEGKITAA